ncbi:MAG: DUF1638 domain-containing protein [Deltaproteobacteria bacterium]|nr:DUF1638 domain-containing protein [Deltaproteobacteria bacterium]
MAVLGIITCQILEREFAHLLANDPEISMIGIIGDEYSQEFSKTLELKTTIRPKSLASAAEYAPTSSDGLEVIVRVIKVGLHSVIPDLWNGVRQAAIAMEPYVDTILLGYGLCGNALKDYEELLPASVVPVILPMDGDHPVDDCIGLTIGGRENYYEEQCRVAGTMFITSGFSRHWKTLLHEGRTAERYGIKMMKRLMASYQRSLLLPTAVATEHELASGSQEFSEIYGLRTEVRPGTLDILEKAWNSAKQVVRRIDSSGK